MNKKILIFGMMLTLLISCGKSKESKTETAPPVKEAKVEEKTTSESTSAPKKNPYLAAELYGISHNDPAQSDTFPYAVKNGDFNADLKKYPQVIGGPINIMTMASTSPDYMWGTSSQGVTYINVADGKFEEVGRLNIPGVKVITEEAHNKVLRQDYTDLDQVAKSIKENYGFGFERIYGGLYSLVDNQNVVYAEYGVSVYAIGLADEKDPKSGVKILRSIELSKILDKGERISGLSMTYDGKLIVIGARSLSVIDRDFKEAPQTVKFGKDEHVSNGASVDENNGIYVASDKYMRKVVWTGTKLSTDEKDGAWQSEYETGQEPPAIKEGTGTGSTPTLMGFGDDEDKLVVITDGANKMHIVAFWRDQIPADFKQKEGTKSNRIADQFSITAGQPADAKWIQSEQSVVVKGYGAFVVDNIVDKMPEDKLLGAIALGPMINSPVGAERVEWDTKTNSWKSVWTRSEVSSVSMVPTVSRASNTVFVNGYYKETGWEITGLDWNTGKTVYRTIFGKDNFGNGAYAIVQFFPNGDLLFDSIAGPIRVSNDNK